MNQVVQLKFIMLIVTDVCICVVIVSEKTRIPRGNPPV